MSLYLCVTYECEPYRALLFGYFILGKQNKVTSRRATPDIQTIRAKRTYGA
jgi:hypothetical protein